MRRKLKKGYIIGEIRKIGKNKVWGYFMEPTENKKKAEELLLYSNPRIVKEKLEKYTKDPNYALFLSSREDKKYMVLNESGKMVHFGQMYYKDYTKTGDEEQRMKFKDRNAKWAGQPKFTPAHLSYNLLW